MSTILRGGDAVAEKGTKAKGSLLLTERNNGAALDTPTLIVRGVNDGPRLWVTAAVHGDEHEGIQAALELFEELNPLELAGTVTLVPISNPLAYARIARVAAEDNVDLNRVFPGDDHGSSTHRIAFSLFTTLKEQADYHMDLHGGGHSLYLHPYTIYYADCEVGEASRRLAIATGFDLVTARHKEDGKGTLYTELGKAGVPSIIAECGGAGVHKDEYAKRHKQGILRVMSDLNMVDIGKPQRLRQRIIERGADLFATGGGMVFLKVRAGDTVSEGQELGRLVAGDATLKETLVSPCDGVITWCRAIPSVSPGDSIASIRRVVEELGSE